MPDAWLPWIIGGLVALIVFLALLYLVLVVNWWRSNLFPRPSNSREPVEENVVAVVGGGEREETIR